MEIVQQLLHASDSRLVGGVIQREIRLGHRAKPTRGLAPISSLKYRDLGSRTIWWKLVHHHERRKSELPLFLVHEFAPEVQKLKYKWIFASA
jgi:hypothetical protein